jgi:hypothetical protein
MRETEIRLFANSGRWQSLIFRRVAAGFGRFPPRNGGGNRDSAEMGRLLSAAGVEPGIDTAAAIPKMFIPSHHALRSCMCAVMVLSVRQNERIDANVS